ncbi:sucrase ferredoxin [Thermoleophilia bacterium SCSIO 60948]|nr:sucrase ferredoxin [Thermoleophilia bacterium SCSIO 60948]
MSDRGWPPRGERCSIRSDLRGDPMLGTAFPASRLLLVEQPFPWGPEGLRTSRFDREIALGVEARAREQGIRVQAIRRPGKSPDATMRRWMLVDTRERSRSIVGGEYGEDAELLDLPLDGSSGEPHTDPLYLVCTHGRHDPCCGERGRPLLHGLDAIRPGSAWQAGHLGGCRFSPTLLVLPLGLMYGRVPASADARLIRATESGELIGEFLRGRIGASPAAQTAIAHAHQELGLPRVADVRHTSGQALDKETVVIGVGTPKGDFEITVKRARVDAAGLTCGAPGQSWFVAHTATTLEPLAARGG